MMSSIVTKEWEEHTCGDGCCFEWGTYLWIDGKVVEEYFSSKVEALQYALEALGHTVEEEQHDE